MQFNHGAVILPGMYAQRHLASRLAKLAGNFPVVVVSGARQVGKTTLLTHEFPGHDLVVFDPSQDVEHARRDPDLFLANHPGEVILDEIQYAPELVSAIKRAVDRAPGRMGRFLLTGSQQWQVLKSVAESMAGRAVFLDLEGFSLGECAQAPTGSGWVCRWLEQPERLLDGGRRLPVSPTLYEQLWRGFLPRATQLDADLVPDYWAGYQRTYIERDARLLGDVSDWQQFGQFLRLCGALTAQEIGYSQLGRDIGVSPQTAQRWLRILVGTYQWFEVPAFGRNLVKRVSCKPKGYMADCGFACHCQHLATPASLAGHPAYGRLFETAVVGEVRKQLALLPGGASLYHWRSNGGAEVDLIVERNGIYHSLEVKGASNPAPRDASGLLAFRQAYPELRFGWSVVVAPMERPRRLAGEVVAIPWDWHFPAGEQPAQAVV